MILEVNYPDDLCQADVLREIRAGIHWIVGGEDPHSPFNQGLSKTKIKRVRKSIWKKFIKP